jgi:hypothetical protein
MTQADDQRSRWLAEAEEGDLRPPFHASAIVNAPAEALRAVENTLLQRFFPLSRAIGNAADGSATRLSDSGHFFYLVEALRRAGSRHIEDTLLMILDDFLQLTERSYDELYLWSIVELSRSDPKHVEVFWPAVVALDERFRFAPWRRPEGVSLVDQPYRMCEMVFYYYAVSTIHLKNRTPSFMTRVMKGFGTAPRLPSLGRCIQRVIPQLSETQKKVVGDTLRQMEREEWRALYGDAFGMMKRI